MQSIISQVSREYFMIFKATDRYFYFSIAKRTRKPFKKKGILIIQVTGRKMFLFSKSSYAFNKKQSSYWKTGVL
jgi:hypothetical protein